MSACTSAEKGEACELDDADGIIGGDYTFVVVVDDSKFEPLILKAQNSASVTLELRNMGTSPHDFSVDCLPTPNDDGCPMEACFEAGAHIPAVEPGETGRTTFEVPRAEGIYEFRSSIDGDTQRGQFVVQ